MKKPHSDHERYIVKALQQGDQKLLAEIYQKHSPQILKWVQNNNGTADDGKDLFQDAIEVVMHNAFKPDFVLTCPLGAFIYQICRNKWLDKLRKKKKDDAVRIKELERYRDNRELLPFANIAIAEQKCQELLERSFLQLTALCQNLLTLLKQNVAAAEVATRLEMASVNTVYRRKFACLKAWKDYAKQESHYEDCKGLY